MMFYPKTGFKQQSLLVVSTEPNKEKSKSKPKLTSDRDSDRERDRNRDVLVPLHCL